MKVNDNYGNNLFSVNFADMENMDTSAPSMSCSATFSKVGRPTMYLPMPPWSQVAQSYDILLKLIP